MLTSFGGVWYTGNGHETPNVFTKHSDCLLVCKHIGKSEEKHLLHGWFHCDLFFLSPLFFFPKLPSFITVTKMLGRWRNKEVLMCAAAAAATPDLPAPPRGAPAQLSSAPASAAAAPAGEQQKGPTPGRRRYASHDGAQLSRGSKQADASRREARSLFRESSAPVWPPQVSPSDHAPYEIRKDQFFHRLIRKLLT